MRALWVSDDAHEYVSKRAKNECKTQAQIIDEIIRFQWRIDKNVLQMPSM